MPQTPTLEQLHIDADDVQKSLERTIDKALARAETVADIEHRADALHEQAQDFRRVTRTMRRRECYNKNVLLSFYITIVLVLLMFIILGACVFYRGC